MWSHSYVTKDDLVGKLMVENLSAYIHSFIYRVILLNSLYKFVLGMFVLELSLVTKSPAYWSILILTS